jgi:hypothetical protein
MSDLIEKLKAMVLGFAKYADDCNMVLICPEDALECNSTTCRACWDAAIERAERETGVEE